MIFRTHGIVLPTWKEMLGYIVYGIKCIHFKTENSEYFKDLPKLTYAIASKRWLSVYYIYIFLNFVEINEL